MSAMQATKTLQLIAPVIAVALILAGCDLLGWLDDGSAIAQTSGSSYAIVDTSQAETYDNVSAIVAPLAGQPFYGQDAQVDGSWQDYIDNGDGDGFVNVA